MRFAAAVFGLLTLFFCVSAFSEQPDASAVRKFIIGRQDKLTGQTVYVDFLGQPYRSEIKKLDADNLTVTILGQEVALAWADVNDRRLMGIARKAIASAADYELLIRFAFGAEMADVVQDLFDSANTDFPNDAEKLAALHKELFPEPEKPKPVEKPADVPTGVQPNVIAPIAPNPAGAFQSVGPGGGGSLYYGSISPHNPNLCFITCDMGGLYRTADGGKNWRMLDQQNVRRSWCFTVFHPTNPNLIFSGGKGGITRSVDGGLTWASVDNNGEPSCIAFDPADPNQMYASFGRRFSPFEGLSGGGQTFGLAKSINGGDGWGKIGLTGVPTDAMVYFVHVDATSPFQMRTLFIGTLKGVFRSMDGGKTWEKKMKGLPSDDVIDVVAWSDAKANKCVLYATVPSKNDGGKFVGGVYKSVDKGENWEPKLNGLNVTLGKKSVWGASDIPRYGPLGISAVSGDVVYVSAEGTGDRTPFVGGVYKTENGGDAWTFIYNWDPRFGGGAGKTMRNGWAGPNRSWQSTPYHIGVNPKDPKQILTSDAGQAFMSRDAGATWDQVYTIDYGNGRWGSAGLEVTTCYWYDVDPYNKLKHYITYTDMGFFRSEDGGKSWIHVLHDELPWRNTCYQMVIDPQNSKMCYLAMANFHDLPEEKMLVTDPRNGGSAVGGVYISRDYCATMEVVGESAGLPNGPGTSIALDPMSDPNARTLYFCSFGRGVYKSVDGGKHWEQKNNGLGSNLNCWRIEIAPDGTLWLGITRKMHSGNEGGALYKSSDGANTWTKVKDFGWLHDVRIFPDKPRTAQEVAELAQKAAVAKKAGVPFPYLVLVGNFSFGGGAGGLNVSQDYGANWKTIYGGNVWGVSVFNDRPETMYAGTPDGLYVSTNSGSAWKEVVGIPFRNCRRVTFDPADPTSIFVTTFGGGIWHGPAAGIK